MNLRQRLLPRKSYASGRTKFKSMKLVLKTSQIIVCSGSILLSSCGDSPKSNNDDSEIVAKDIRENPETAAYYLYELAKDSNTKRNFDKKSYSKTVSICCMIGLTKKFPIHFIEEQRGVNFLASFDADDPLGWSGDLGNGAFVTIQASLGLIVLEYPPHPKTGIRDIKDVIQYSAKEYPNIDSNFYTQLASIVKQCVSEANIEHNEMISKASHVPVTR